MGDAAIRRRVKDTVPDEVSHVVKQTAGNAEEPHPAGEVKHGAAVELLRLLLFTSWFVGCCVCVTLIQLIGSPLYFVNRDYYYAYMALTKQSFGIFIVTITQWFSPTVIRVSWDHSVQGQLRKTPDGRMKTTFPERMVLVSNHQIYTDWLYLWWTAYTSRMHGHIFIILKESLKYMPLLSPGILFFGFIFMARKWTSDQVRMKYRLQKLKARHSGPMSGTSSLDPMWLLIFPEGTNLSANTRKSSASWAAKQGIPDLKHALIPRSTGLQFCLSELDDSVDWVYDCTIAYEGVPYVLRYV
jgi:1-acyl-sn-glycerol-3-phosphate acyltransferase